MGGNAPNPAGAYTATNLPANMDAWQTMLDAIGFSQQARFAITFDEGIDCTYTLGHKTKDQLEEMVRTLRRPGGLIPALAGAAPGTMINNPGIAINDATKDKLVIAAFMCRQRRLMSRSTDPATIRNATLGLWFDRREAHLAKSDSTIVLSSADYHKNWTRAFEAMDSYLQLRLSDLSGIPLAYLVRETQVPKPEDDDPSTNYGGNWVAEQIARCPHFEHLPAGSTVATTYYVEDNIKLWHILHELFKAHQSFTHLKPFQKKQDGRGAYRALFDYHLGKKHLQNRSRATEATLNKLRYTGESKRFTFDRYVNQHKDAHTILDGLKQYGYSGIDNASKVRRFLDGIQYKPLDSAKYHINTHDTLDEDFDGVVNFLKNTLIQNNLMSGDSTAQISATAVAKGAGTKTANNKKSSGGGKSVGFAPNTKQGNGGGTTPQPTHYVDVEDRYYTNEEYKDMSQDQRLSLKMKREKKHGNSGSSAGRGKTNNAGGGTKFTDVSGINPDYVKKIAAAAVKAANKSAQKKSKTEHPSVLKKSKTTSYASDSEGSSD